MSPEVVSLVLVAATFHAVWNALVKIRADRIIVMMLVTLAGALISILALPFVEAPAPESWGFLAATVVVHTVPIPNGRGY